MLCEKCKINMIHICENSVQGWSCPVCGWEILTTHIAKIYQDMTEYTIEDEIIENEREQFLNEKMIRMLEVLSPRQKEIIYYRFVEGLSYEEICQIMDMNYQSTQNLIQRSLKKLRTTFSQAEMQFVLLLLISM